MMLLQQEFTETKIATKFGEFNIRVYSDDLKKETLVLWKESLDTSSPVLVRVHSECITGDMIGSLQCDCGEQLARSLQLIDKEGGVLIYLRQEGRGIGLFEKIKTYQLQAKGYDTFEANILLGHRPDERTYEMVKIVLNDLNVNRIRLLTNNPSKVSEITKLGIDVVERVPLIIKPNKHNKRYFITKRNKFQHSFETKANYYFYQFHVDTSDEVKQISKFLKSKKRDPYLKICVGITATSSSLSNKKEILRIKSIFHVCEQEELIPVLHFSFRESLDVIKEIGEIKRVLPFVNRIQINDISQLEMKHIKYAYELFSVDIPLSDENFDLVHNKQFKSILKKHKGVILLDNSKGRGILESKESLMKKIDTLLGYGINTIALCGGFGPDELDRYFDLRRYYRINFSIDAETKLKTNGKVNIEKTKLYLLQLIRFDDPKQDGIDQTRKFLKQHQRTDWDKVTIENKEFLIHPNVFHSGLFPATAWYAKKICELVKNQLNFCEVGCGSGAISCLVALTNPKVHVIATDISSFASENTLLNAQRLGVEDKMEVLTGDVLDSVTKGDRFDSIFWLLPFGFLDPGASITLEETQVFDPGYRALRKFFQTAKKFLKPQGKLLIGFSSDLGHPDLLDALAKEFKIKLEKIDEQILVESEAVKFELLVGTYY